MSVYQFRLITFCAIFSLSSPALAELQDQGLNSILQIIDKAVGEVTTKAEDEEDEAATKARMDAASATISNLSRTLGTLSYSRLQCGEAGVLAEFTQRVQLMPVERRDLMRDAFQEGFDKSKEETTLLSEDECKRLTQSRKRSEIVDDVNVKEDPKKETAIVEAEPEVVEIVEEDPKLGVLRIAELSGQLAYKHKFCKDDKVFNRDFNQYISGLPEEYRADAKDAYWKGFKRGKRLNKGLRQSDCK